MHIQNYNVATAIKMSSFSGLSNIDLFKKIFSTFIYIPYSIERNNTQTTGAP